jgi:CHASE3 domain sensor protein
VAVKTADKSSEAKWADQYFKQWQEAKEELHITQERLAEYRADYELQEKTIADLRNEIGKSYIAGMEQQQRCAVERIKQWVADNVAITGFDTIYTRLVNAVVWAVELKAVDKDQPAD